MENKIVFENENYSDSIVIGYGKWIDMDPKDIIGKIINNIRLVHYNYEYKAPVEISPLAIMFDRTIVDRAIDRVMHHIDITTDVNKEVDGYKMVSDKKIFRKLVLKGEDKFISIDPTKSTNKLTHTYELYHQLDVIARYLKSKVVGKVCNAMSELYK